MKKKFITVLTFLCLLCSFPSLADEDEAVQINEDTEETEHQTRGILRLTKAPKASELDEAVIENDGGNVTAELAVSYALTQRGLPYSQARRMSGSAYDCSSLVYLSYLHSGVDISYGGDTTAAGMAHGLVNANKVVSGTTLKPGDLIFYSYGSNGRYRNIDHVAMYAGGRKQVESSKSRGGVVLGNINLSHVVCICRPMA